MKLDKPLRIAIPALIVIAILIAFLLPWQCAQAQTAGEFTMTFSYGANVDEQFTEMRGANWIKSMKDELREHWQNRKNEAKESYAQRRAQLFNFDDVSGLDNNDKNVLKSLYDKQKTWEIKQKRRADSAAIVNKVIQ